MPNWFNIQPTMKSEGKNTEGSVKIFSRIKGPAIPARSTRGLDPWREIEFGVRVRRGGFSRSFEVAGRTNGTRGSAECRPSGWQYPCPVLSCRIILPYLSRTAHSQTLIPCPFSSFAVARLLSRCLEMLSRLEHPATGENYCILKQKTVK